MHFNVLKLIGLKQAHSIKNITLNVPNKFVSVTVYWERKEGRKESIKSNIFLTLFLQLVVAVLSGHCY